MSTFKIYAKKGSKVMPIKIEEKHLYEHAVSVDNEGSLNIYQPTSSGTIDITTGYGVYSGNIKVLNNSNNLTISQGTSEDERVGNKINVKSISITLYIRFNSSVLIASFSHGQMIDTYFNFRLMTVRFDQAMSTTDLARWYRESFIYYRHVSVATGDKFPFQSNWMDKLRESTPYTGAFEILYDKKFKLKKSKSVKTMNVNIPLSGNVNFDNISNKPTANQKFCNVYTFIIGPSNAYLDMDAISTDKVLNLSSPSATLFYYQANIKTIYYDV